MFSVFLSDAEVCAGRWWAVLFTRDWESGIVSTSANLSTISWSDNMCVFSRLIGWSSLVFYSTKFTANERGQEIASTPGGPLYPSSLVMQHLQLAYFVSHQRTHPLVLYLSSCVLLFSLVPGRASRPLGRHMFKDFQRLFSSRRWSF